MSGAMEADTDDGSPPAGPVTAPLATPPKPSTPAPMDIDATIAEDEASRKRKSPPTDDDDEDDVAQSPLKRQRAGPDYPLEAPVLSAEPTSIPSSTPSALPSITPLCLPTPLPTLSSPSSLFASNPVSTTGTADITMTSTSSPPPPAYYAPRENMQFNATEVPKDDDGMMRWLAHRVRDSAAGVHRLSKSEHSPERGGAGDSDPETRAERERVRAENRERKKKWREENSDRNKDNDLRGRVSRRANKLFGAQHTERKQLWMEDEFNRRKVKREFKTQLKKNETPGSSCWNANDDFSDNPSQVMAGVLTNQEGAAESFRTWLEENGEIDEETWEAACRQLWGDPGMREYVESLAPEIAPVVEVAGQRVEGGAGPGEMGTTADDGLASKFDAAFDAIIGRPAPKSAMLPPPKPAVPEVVVSEALEVAPDVVNVEPNGVEGTEAGLAAAMELDGAVEVEQGGDGLGQLTEDDLHRLIESGEMSLEEIAALEAALGDETALDGHVEDAMQLPMMDGEQGVQTETMADMALPELHSDHADISDLHMQLEMMSPNTRDTFLATLAGPVEGAHGSITEMQLEGPLLVDGLGASEITNDAVPTEGAADDGSILELLESAGINLDDLDEDQLQRFINAISGDGDIDEALAGFQATQQGQTTVDHDIHEHDHVIPDLTEQQIPQAAAMDTIDEEGDFGMAVDDDDAGYGDGEGDYDDDDEVDLTPDIMRIILEHSNYSSILGGQTLEGLTSTTLAESGGDAHTIQPMPSVHAPPPQMQMQPKTPARQTYPMIQQQQQQQQRMPQYTYTTSRYGSSYWYGYQRRPEVQVLPPGYSAHQRPPMAPAQQMPRYPDLSSLIKPLAYMPTSSKLASASTEKGVGEGSGNAIGGAGTVTGSMKNGWSDIFGFKIPIPSFMGRDATGAVVDREKLEEEKKNARAMGYPPMATVLKL